MSRNDRRTTVKRIRRRRFISLAILFILLGSGLVFGSKFMSNKKVKAFVNENYKEELSPEKENKTVGDMKSIVDYDKDKIIIAHYPETGKKNIDKEIKALVDKSIKDFETSTKDFKAKELKDAKSLYIDYSINTYKENINSLDMKVAIDKHPSKEYLLAFDSSLDSKLGAEDLFVENAILPLNTKTVSYFSTLEDTKSKIEDETVRTSLSASLKPYSNFLITDESLEFIFPEISATEKLSIPLAEFDSYLKYDLENFQKLSQEQIDEKIEILERAGAIRPGLDPNKPMVALTYDDGPSSKVTGPILDKLKEYNSAATFFVLGENAKLNPTILKRMSDEGHEIANHSYSHKLLTKLSVDGIKDEYIPTQNIVKDAVGYEPTLYRPPYGGINDSVKATIPMPLMLWSVDTLDWKSRNADAVTSNILNNVKDGDIILMHDLYDSTKEASFRVIPELINRGYQLVTVSEMYQLKGVELQAGGRYTNIDPK